MSSISISLKQKYNWKRSSIPLTSTLSQIIFPSHNKQPLNKTIDLTTTHKFPPVYNQGQIGSCTANALCCAYYYYELNNFEQNLKIASRPAPEEFSKHQPFEPSRLYLYFKERSLEHTIQNDDGAVISDGLKVLMTTGVCSEHNWSYSDEGTKFSQTPSPVCDIEAKNHIVVQAKHIKQTLQDLKSSLDHNLPFVFGIVCFNELDNLSKENGWILSLPSSDEQSIGGHAIICVGYNDDKKLFKIRNSWGAEWGDKGHFYIPYDYVTNPDLASDFCVLSLVRDLDNLKH